MRLDNRIFNFELSLKQKNERRLVMGWFKKEAKAFGKEFVRQGSILLFGKPKRRQPRSQYKNASAKYRAFKRWARSNGFN